MGRVYLDVGQDIAEPTIRTAADLSRRGGLDRRIRELSILRDRTERKYRENRRHEIAMRFSDAQVIFGDPALLSAFLKRKDVANLSRPCLKPEHVLRAYFSVSISDPKAASKDRRLVDSFWPLTSAEEVLKELQAMLLQTPTVATGAPADQGGKKTVVFPKGLKGSKKGLQVGSLVAFTGTILAMKKSGSVKVEIDTMSLKGHRK